MDLTTFGLNTDDLAVRDAIRQLVARHIEPHAADVDENETFPREGFDALASAEFTGLLVAPEYGGGGGTMLQYCIVMEEIAAACAATAATYMTQIHGTLPVLLAGDDAQRRRWLPDAASGRRLASIAITEPQAGSDIAGMRTAAERVDGGYRLSGQKIFITNGNQADLMCVFARTDLHDRRGGVSIFAVELPRRGVSFGKPLKKMGIRGSDTAEVFFDDVFVPEDCRLGNEGIGFGVAVGALGSARVSTAAQAVGIARRAYETAYRYAQEREQFGRPIARFQAVQLALMDMHMRVNAASLMLYQVARYIDSGARAEYGLEAAMAKVYCSDVAMEVSSSAVDVLGGYGYMREYGVERLMRDAKITQIYDGTNAINRLNMARSMGQRERAAAREE